MATITLTSEEQTINLVTEGSVSLSASNGKSAYQSYLSTTSDDPVLTEAEWSEGGGGGGGDYLPLAGGIMDNGAEIAFDNASKIRQTPGSNGIDQVCSIDYVHRWKEGALYIIDQSGGIRSVQYGLSFTPDSTFDITQGYLVGSRFIKDDGTVFECTDNTDGAAVWVDVTPLSSVEVTSATATDITGLLKGDGSAVSAATAGTDYVATDDARLTDARTPTSHVHGGISDAGAIGSTAGLPIKTGTSGVLEVGAFGTSAGQFAQGDDSRFHDRSHAMTSTSDHTAGNWKVFHSNGSGQLVELALGADGTYLKSNGASLAPSFATPAGGGASITGTGIAYVRAGGVDLEGTIGDPSKPYLTAQAAWDDGARKFELGAGSYSISHTSQSGTTPEEFVFVQGIGKEFCSLSITWGAVDGTPGASSGAFQQTGGNGEVPSKLNLQSDSTVALLLSLSSGDGGNGGNGEAGTSEVPGGNGSSGGDGGVSPEFQLSNCYLESFSCVAGMGGEKGIGGVDGGAGPGMDGADGLPGLITGGRFEWCYVPSSYAPAYEDIFLASTVEGVGKLVVDGSKGDITVSGAGTSWSITNNSVALEDLVVASAKGKIIGRKTAGSGNFEECDIADFMQVAATTGNITDTIGTLADVAGMSFSIASNEKVVAIFRGFWATSVSGSGFKYSFTGPGSPTDVQIGDLSFTSATALRTESGMTAFNTTATQGGGTLLNSAMPIMIQIYVRNGGTPGTVQLRMGGEVNGSTFTLYKGFTMQVLRIP